MFWKKKKTKLELLREAALDHAHDALETAQEVLHQATGAVHGTLEHAPEKLEDLRSGAGDSLGEAVSRVSNAVAALGSRVGDVAHVAKQGAQYQLSHAGEFAAEHAEDTRHAVEEKRRQLAKKLSRKQHDAQKKKEEVIAHIPEITLVEGNQKWVWLGVGILIGAALGVLLAPSSGRRNRAAIRNQAVKGAHKVEDLGEAASRKARDLSNKAEGVAHTVAGKVSAKYNGDSDDADDVTIADRVRTALGHLPEAHALERINVDSSDGVVTLRGPVVDTATQAALIAAVGQVAGVREVVSDLLVEDDTEETFVG